MVADHTKAAACTVMVPYVSGNMYVPKGRAQKERKNEWHRVRTGRWFF
jgi:hypothetical protein